MTVEAKHEPKPQAFEDLQARKSPLHKRKRSTNLAILGALIAFMAVVFVMTIARMGAN